MSKTTVANRAGVSLATVNRILSGKERRLTIDNIGAIARALGVVIRIGDTTAIEEVASDFEFRRTQAVRKAERVVAMVQGTMALESQAVGSKQVRDMIEQTTCELLAGPARKLWAD